MSATVTDSDLQLLTRYTRQQAEDAFAEIVRRHLDLVHSAALRQVRSPQLAEEVAQSVFTDLARNARHLAPDTILPAWLYQVTRRTAIDVVRREARRQLREQIATEMNAMNQSSHFAKCGHESEWADIEPLLDEAMSALDETDRAAILLRYFENKSLREVGTTFGTSDDAAQKRVSRAVERLREFFAKRGVTVGASGLVLVISANAVQAAPVGLAVTISTAAALAGAVTATTLPTTTAVTAMNWINLKSITAICASALIAGTGTHLVQQREVNGLRNENERLAAARRGLTEERAAALSASTANNEELERARRERIELLRLRGEVGTLRARAKDLENLESQIGQLQASLAKANQPAQKAEAATEAELQRETAIAKMNDAKHLVLSLMLFASDNQNQLPADFSQASNYWGTALTGTNQFELVIQGSLQNITNADRVVAVREREPSFVKGKWFKAYGFADGHAEYKTEPPEGFEAWEKQHMLAPLKNP